MKLLLFFIIIIYSSYPQNITQPAGLPANKYLWSKITESAYQDEIISIHSHDAFNDAFFDLQWGLKEIGFDLWHEPEQKRSKIFIIDTGAPCDTLGNITHSDLQNSRIKVGTNFSQVYSITEKGDTIILPQLNRNWDEIGHGTHVAGIASALKNNNIGIVGVNNVSDVVFTKVLRDYIGWGYVSWLMYALAEADSVSQKEKIDVVCNLSLGSVKPFRPLEELIKKLDKTRKVNGYGVILVCSAGNMQSEGLDYPANYSHTGFISQNGYDNVISVGAVSTTGIAEYSNYGDYVDIFAPGGGKPIWKNNTEPASLDWKDGIYSTYPDSTIKERFFYPNKDFGGQNFPYNYGYNSGTSMAAPFVSAAVAAYINKFGHVDAKTIKHRLRQSGIPFNYRGYIEDQNGVKTPNGHEFIGYKLYLPDLFDELLQTTDVSDLNTMSFYVTNYPNPFNSSTIIEYFLEEPADVTLKFYNTLGQQVQSIHPGFEHQGIHKVNFDAKTLSSGVYYCVVSLSDQRHLTRKIQFIK